MYVTPPYTVFCESVEELKSEKSEGLFEANLGYTSSNSDAPAVLSELPAVFISN